MQYTQHKVETIETKKAAWYVWSSTSGSKEDLETHKPPWDNLRELSDLWGTALCGSFLASQPQLHSSLGGWEYQCSAICILSYLVLVWLLLGHTSSCTTAPMTMLRSCPQMPSYFLAGCWVWLCSPHFYKLPEMGSHFPVVWVAVCLPYLSNFSAVVFLSLSPWFFISMLLC